MYEKQASEAQLWIGVPNDNQEDLTDLCSDVRQIGTRSGEALKAELLVGKEQDKYRAFIVITLQKRVDGEEVDLGFLADELMAKNLHILTLDPDEKKK